MFPGMANQWKC